MIIHPPMKADSPPTTADNDPDRPEAYQLLTRLGSGGMAEVHLALHRGAADFQQLVVIKRIGSQRISDDKALRMFIDEAHTVAALNHPHIVKIIDLRRLGAELTIAMEYVDGESFGHVMQYLHAEHGGFPTGILCKYMLDACEALYYAHTATAATGEPLNLVHRDISPQNLMLDRNGVFKIIDFGIAKSNLRTQNTSSGLMKGRFAYVAPDGLRGGEVDQRSDIYSLGLVFFEALTGRRAQKIQLDRPYDELVRQVLDRKLPPPSSVRPEVPPALDAIVVKATAKDRNKRYASAADMASDIHAFMMSGGMTPGNVEVRAWFHDAFEARIAARRALEQTAIIEASANAAGSKVVGTTPEGGQAIADDDVTRTPSGSSSGPLGASNTAVAAARHRRGGLFWPLAVTLLVAGALVVAMMILEPALRREMLPPAPPTVVPILAHNLFVVSQPPTADVYLDHIWVGSTGPSGLALNIEPGTRHDMRLVKDAYLPYFVVVEGAVAGQQRVEAALHARTRLLPTMVVFPSPPDAEPPPKRRRRRHKSSRAAAMAPSSDAAVVIESPRDTGSSPADAASLAAADGPVESDAVSTPDAVRPPAPPPAITDKTSLIYGSPPPPARKPTDTSATDPGSNSDP